ncbi:MAG: metallophosphoesterase [Oscillospiraceae bacterium]|nr:metallophosphoesterase [Oscillospiraceae bacterium]
MGIYHEDIANIELSSGQIFRSFMNHTIGSGDVLANRFGVRVFRNGEPENIGGTCMGLFIRADGTTVTISSGVVSGNVAYVTLPEVCYAVEGQFSLAIKCQGSGVTGTLRIVDGVVSRTSTSAVVDPGMLVPSIEDLIDAIEDAVETIPADYSGLWTTLAPAFSTSTEYKAGQYVTYDGKMYKFTTDHVAGTWNSAHVIQVNVGGETADLKSAIMQLPDIYDNAINPVAGVFSGLKWENGVLKNNLVDGKTTAQIYVQLVSKTGTVTTADPAITEIGHHRRTVYCTANTKYIQIRHNGSTRDLYARFEVSFSKGTNVIVEFDVGSVVPNSIGGISISNIYARAYMINKWSASIDQTHALLIPNKALPTVQMSGNDAVVTLNVGSSGTFTNIPELYKTLTVAQFAEQISDYATVSGDVLTIRIPHTYALFYDYENNSAIMSQMTVEGMPGANCLALFTNYYGHIHGSWKELILEKDISGKKDDKLPDYYISAIETVSNKLASLPPDNFNYLFFTDIHYSYPTIFTEKKLLELTETIKTLANGTNIDAVIFGGDLIEGGYAVEKSVSVGQENAVFQPLGDIRKPVLSLFGNHDNNMYNWNSAPAETKNVSHYITMPEWENRAVYPFGESGNYYYVDFPNKNMRVVVVNACDYRPSVDDDGNVSITDYSEIMMRRDQLDNIAQMFHDSPYDIVVCSHGLVTGLFGICSKYNSRGTYTKQDSTVIDFSNMTHHVRNYHTGHYHNNAMEYVEGYNVNCISTSCACMAPAQQTLYAPSPTDIVTAWQDTGPVAYNNRVIPRIINTITETCFDVVSVASNKITKFGVGGSSDGVLDS